MSDQVQITLSREDANVLRGFMGEIAVKIPFVPTMRNCYDALVSALDAEASLNPQPAQCEPSAASAPTDGVSDAELTEAVEQFGWARQHLGRWYERDPHDPRATRQEQVARTEQTNLMTMIRAAMRAAQEGR